MNGNSLLLELADVAASQWGMVTTAQARAVGFTPQQVAALCRAGTVQRLRHGVYRLAGVAEDELMELRAAWLALDPAMMVEDRLAQEAPEVVSHRSAAVLHGIGDLDADVWEFTVATRRQSRRHDTRFYLGEPGRGDWTVIGGLPVTTVLVTIGDLAAARIDRGHLAGVVRDAVVTLHLDVGAVAAVLRPHAHHYGAPLGDGQQLVEQFLTEAGVPASTVAVGELVSRQRAAAMAGLGGPASRRCDSAAAPDDHREVPPLPGRHECGRGCGCVDRGDAEGGRVGAAGDGVFGGTHRSATGVSGHRVSYRAARPAR